MKTLILLIFCTFLLIMGCESTPVNSVIQQSNNSDCYIIIINDNGTYARYEAKVESFFYSKGLLFINRTDSAQLVIVPDETTHIAKDSTFCQ